MLNNEFFIGNRENKYILVLTNSSPKEEFLKEIENTLKGLNKRTNIFLVIFKECNRV